jgi:hypothetical protein
VAAHLLSVAEPRRETPAPASPDGHPRPSLERGLPCVPGKGHGCPRTACRRITGDAPVRRIGEWNTQKPSGCWTGGRRFPQGVAPGWYVLPFQGSRSPRREAVASPHGDQPLLACTDAPSTHQPSQPHSLTAFPPPPSDSLFRPRPPGWGLGITAKRDSQAPGRLALPPRSPRLRVRPSSRPSHHPPRQRTRSRPPTLTAHSPAPAPPSPQTRRTGAPPRLPFQTEAPGLGLGDHSEA